MPATLLVRQERAASMILHAFVQEAEFGPELLASMGLAYVAACEALGLADKADKATELVAGRIIALARHGEHDAERLTAAVLETFRE